jgi:hypothetical protein
MGFWSKLFGKKDANLNLKAVDSDGDGKVQDGTIWERPADLVLPTIEEVEKQVDQLLEELFVEEKPAPKKAPAKKPAAKKPTAPKAPAEKNPAAKPAAKKPATKKPSSK